MGGYQPPITVAEFFTGIGGMHAALRASGVAFEIAASYEIDESCCKVYDLNFGAGIVSRRNIEAIGSDELDKTGASLWLMSPPCQPFTRQKEYGRREVGDLRLLPFLNLLSNMTKMRNPPKFFLLENVPEFASSDACLLLKRELAKLNFVSKEYILDSQMFGIPNRRNRFYLIARRHYAHDTSMEACGTCGRDPVSASAFPEVAPKMLSEYVDMADSVYAESCSIPDSRLLRYVYCTEVVDGTSTSSSCFTKNFKSVAERAGIKFFRISSSVVRYAFGALLICSYGRYVKGTGAVLKCNPEIKMADALKRLERCETDMERLRVVRELKIRLFHPDEIKLLLGFPRSFRKIPRRIHDEEALPNAWK